MFETFVYEWYDRGRDMYYIGSRKGTPDDGYVCSSKIMMPEYHQRPHDFSRTILGEGPDGVMRQVESVLLCLVNAANNPRYYNQHNSDGKFICVGPKAEEHKAKISSAQKGKSLSDIHKKRLSAAKQGKSTGAFTMKGKCHTPETKLRMSTSHTGRPSPTLGKHWHWKKNMQQGQV